MTRTRSLGLSMLALVLAAGGLLAVPSAAQACGGLGGVSCAARSSDGGDGGGDGGGSSRTRYDTYSSGTQTCSVYGSGTGMGSYCLANGTVLRTLRDRFGGQKFQQCRYSELPPGVEAPPNENPDQGHYMLRECIANVDFDTYSGGKGKTLAISVVFVLNGTDTSILHNDITDFLWDRIQQDAQLPVPFMRPRPSLVPIVGVPTFFTFQWLDPATKRVVQQGPYSDSETGGPYRQIESNGLIMRAEATKIEVDPKQTDLKQITCTPDTPYTEGAAPNQQPKDACRLTFKRSSASVRQFVVPGETIPDSVGDAYYPTIRIYWKISYGEDENNLQPLGDDFVMRVRQSVPVQEVQAPNQPPSVTFD